MENLYGRLFKYRTREGRAPLEDFLSEALVDLLQRMPAEVVSEMLALILGPQSSGALQLAGLLAQKPQLNWTTQRRVDFPNRGIIDVLLEIDDLPAIVIENKIGSGLRPHASETDEGTVTRNQLSTYGTWLASMADKTWGGALVLLTHVTSAPADFLDRTASHYGVPHRSTITWSTLAKWFGQTLSKERNAGMQELWVPLADDFIAFLKEQEMTTETVSAADLAALQVFLPTVDRLFSTLDRAWLSSRAIREEVCTNKKLDPEFDGDGGTVWRKSHTKQPPAPRHSYIGFGIRFPDQSSWWEGASLPARPHAFLCVGANSNSFPATAISSLPASWLRIENQLVTSIELHELPADPDDLTDALSEWVSMRSREAVAIIHAMSAK